MLWLPTFADGASLATMHAGNPAGNRDCAKKNVGLTFAWNKVPAGSSSHAVTTLGALTWPPGKLPILLAPHVTPKQKDAEPLSDRIKQSAQT